MIENVYRNAAGEEEYQVSGRKPPKNVRQAGYFSGDLRIYIEDYVHTFTRWLAEQDYSSRCAAVLVGEFAKSEHTRDVYAYGTVVMENACIDGKVEMTADIWTQIYETIKSYFPEGEIVGWFYGGTSFTEEEKEMLSQVHLDHFAGTDRILMLYDFLDREEEFYRFEGEGLVRQTGHYIYYEKNTEMQNYMVDKKQGKNAQEEVEDRAVKEMRGRLGVQIQLKGEEAGKPKKEAKEKTADESGNSASGPRLLYAAGIIMAAVAVVTGASMLYNQERLKGFEQTLDQIIGAVRQEAAETDAKVNEEQKNAGSIFDNPQVKETFKDENSGNENKDNNRNDENNQNNSSKNNENDDNDKNNENNGGDKNNQNSESNDSDKSNQNSENNSGDKNNENNSNDKNNGSDKNSDNDKNENNKEDKEKGQPSTNTPSITATPESTGGKINTENGEPAKTSEGTIAPTKTPEEPIGTLEADKSENDSASITGGADDGNDQKEASGGLLDTSNYSVYIVQPGDTLVGICMKRYGNLENLEYIKGLNQISNENLIFAYQELLIP